MGAASVPSPFGSDLIDYISERSVGRKIDPSAETDSYLRGIIAPEDIAVLYEGDLEAKTCSRDSSTFSGDSSSYYDKVENSLILNYFLSKKNNKKALLVPSGSKLNH